MNELRDLLKSETGRLLKEYLMKRYDKFNTLEGMTDFPDPESFALEVKARLKARDWIRDLLVEIMDAEAFEKLEKKDEDKLYNL
jgi:hypothetical protein